MTLISILVFFVVTFLMVAIVVVVASMVMHKASREEQSEALTQLADGSDGLGLLRNERLSTISLWDGLLARFDFFERMKSHLAQSELGWSVGRLTSMMLLFGALALAVLFRLSVVPQWAALLGSIAIAFAPYAFILNKRSRRFQRFRENFPDSLDSLARALRAGYSFSAALEAVSQESPAPVSAELRQTATEVNLGMAWSQALANLGRRMPVLEVNLFAAAVQLHARTGGKLSEVMGGLAETMRESVALQGEVRSMAAHGRLTGIILTCLPFGIAGMMSFVNPGYMMVLVEHPYGKHLISAALVCLVLAQLVIRKIVDIEV
ncbi:MAG: type II secretion system F family protein [Bryobacteraceae bacterium]